MNIITLDFETYYTKGLGFKTQTTEEYVRDRRFEVIGVGVKIADAPATWFSGTKAEIHNYLSTLPWDTNALLCHNTLFDGCILSWHFGITPIFMLDTLCMARALHGVDVGGSLASLSARYGIGQKGDEVLKAEGKRREDFTKEELATYGDYCINDVELTYKLWKGLSSAFPDDELGLIDMTLRMFTHPVFMVDDALLQDRAIELKEEKLALLEGLMGALGCKDAESVRKKLASNKQFAELLEARGIPIPMKTSKTTGKETYALAKNDEEFLALLEHEDPEIQQLCAVRLGTKSTLEESRIERFIEVGKRNKGYLPIPLKYYGAHTGRWAGSDKVNFQNLPSRDKKKKALKTAVIPPDGHVVINCDSSQIEARVLVWLAGQDDVVKQFANGEDVYSVFASKIYDRPISKANPIERFVGKTCVAEGTLVLSDSGWKPIELVTTADKLWDGEEWVCHQGLVNNGIKPTLNLCGAWLTPDHQVWSGTQWLEAQLVVADKNILYQVLDTAVENLPLQATLLASEKVSKHSSSNATAIKSNIRLTTIISKISRALGAIFAPKQRHLQNAIGCTAMQWQMMNTGLAYSIASLQQSQGATTQPTKHIPTTEDVAYQCTSNGEIIELCFFTMYKHSKGGMSRVLKWTGLMSTATTNLTTYSLYPEVTTLETNEKSQTLRPVFDILNCGSRNRFTILTEAGPVIVHNCILGLGYGTGKLKLQHTLKTTPPGITVTEEEADNYVNIYRKTNDKVIQLWKDGDAVLKDLANWGNTKPRYYGEHKCLKVFKEGIQLPNGLYIRYPDLKLDTTESKSSYAYASRNGKVTIWGGTLVENVVQALARIVVGEQMLKINRRYRVGLTVHDAAVCVVPEEELDSAMAYIVECMSTPPDWARGLPVSCEAKHANSYGEC